MVLLDFLLMQYVPDFVRSHYIGYFWESGVLRCQLTASICNSMKSIKLAQPVITTRIYVLHKIMIALKFMFYINSDLPIPAKKPQASHNVQGGITAWKPVGS